MRQSPNVIHALDAHLWNTGKSHIIQQVALQLGLPVINIKLNKEQVTMRKVDYPELAKTELFFSNSKMPGRDMVKVIVVDANYHIGITLVLKSNPKIKVYCLNRASMLAPGKGLRPTKREYQNLFYATIECIRAGEIYDSRELVSEHVAAYRNSPATGNQAACAWQ